MKPHRYFTPREWHAFPFLAKTHPLPRKEGNLQSGHQPDYTTRVKPLSLWSLLLSVNPACASQTLSLAPTQRSLLAAPCHSAASRTPKRPQALWGRNASRETSPQSRGRSLGLGRALRHLPSCSQAERGEAERSAARPQPPAPSPFPQEGPPRPLHPPPRHLPGAVMVRAAGDGDGAGAGAGAAAGAGALAPPAGGSARGRPSRGRFLGPAGGCLCPPRPASAAPAPAPGRGFGARCCRAPVCQVLRGPSGMLRERALPAAPLRGEKGKGQVEGEW